ncbi:MAG: hypothetical protein VX986_01175 [Pseudomonadota bacterium]|nr:hypothetical protein [Pseudomonadota bacterium]
MKHPAEKSDPRQKGKHVLQTKTLKKTELISGFLLFACLFFHLQGFGATIAEPSPQASPTKISDDVTQDTIKKAQLAYSEARFVEAKNILENALADNPKCAECLHLLGKSLGRMAQNASFFSAVRLARQTKKAFEEAIALRPDSTAALQDLIQFHHSAPRIVGGSRKKAQELERLLKEIQSKNGHPGHD